LDLGDVAHADAVAVEDLMERCLAMLPGAAAAERRAGAKPVHHRQLVVIAMS
jgi:hypothetical protein